MDATLRIFHVGERDDGRDREGEREGERGIGVATNRRIDVMYCKILHSQ